MTLLAATGDLVPALNSIGDALLELPTGVMVLVLVVVTALVVTLGAPIGLLATPSTILVAQRVDDFATAVFLSATATFFALCLSAAISFWLGLTVFKSWAVELSKKNRIYRAVGMAIQRNGATVSALLRMCVIPAAVDYNMAAMGCSYRAFVLGLSGHGEARRPQGSKETDSSAPPAAASTTVASAPHLANATRPSADRPTLAHPEGNVEHLHVTTRRAIRHSPLATRCTPHAARHPHTPPPFTQCHGVSRLPILALRSTPCPPWRARTATSSHWVVSLRPFWCVFC